VPRKIAESAGLHPKSLDCHQDGEMFGQAIPDEVDTFDRSSIAFATIEGRGPQAHGEL
jgi:hypothetical protein